MIEDGLGEPPLPLPPVDLALVCAAWVAGGGFGGVQVALRGEQVVGDGSGAAFGSQGQVLLLIVVVVVGVMLLGFVVW